MPKRAKIEHTETFQRIEPLYILSSLAASEDTDGREDEDYPE